MVAQEKDLDRQVQEIAAEFPGEVVGIRYSLTNDWTGDPAVFFRILLTDEAARPEVLGDVATRVRRKLFDFVYVWDSNYFPYCFFRSNSEEVAMRDPEWPLPTTS